MAAFWKGDVTTRASIFPYTRTHTHTRKGGVADERGTERQRRRKGERKKKRQKEGDTDIYVYRERG
jgi:hypothetical protein